jgi:hypothetical protein
MSKQYLGDGVYADFNGHDLTLTTENGIAATNIIILEREVFMALVRYMERMTGMDQRQENQ